MALCKALNRIERIKSVHIVVNWRNGKRTIYKGRRK